MPALRDKLIEAGIQVYITDGIYNANIYNRDYDLCIFLHYDGGGTGERCMVSAPNRATLPAYLNSEAFTESEKFAQIWKATYPEIVGVSNKDSAITAGMRDYYAFDYVGLDTPTVIVEHFNHTSPRGTELKEKPELVAEADFQAIIKYLGVTDVITDDKYRITYKGEILSTYDYNPEDKITSCVSQNEKLQKQLADKIKEVAEVSTALQAQEIDNAQLSTDLRACSNKRDSLQVDLKVAQKEIEDCEKEVIKLQAKIDALESFDPLEAYSKWELFLYILNKGKYAS